MTSPGLPGSPGVPHAGPRGSCVGSLKRLAGAGRFRL